MSNKKFHYSAKGYYIALVLCAAAIGVSGYLFYRNDRKQAEDLSAAVAQDTRQEQVEAVATQPGLNQADTTLPAQAAQQTQQKPSRTTLPVDGELVAEYAMDCLSYNETTRDWRVHAGMDLAAETGTEVKAAADGEVYTVYEDDAMGMTVVIRHSGGYTTHYASLADDVCVKAGDKVTVGQKIGTVGQTALMESALGPHVCFRVTCDGDVVDPEDFLNG